MLVARQVLCHLTTKNVISLFLKNIFNTLYFCKIYFRKYRSTILTT